MKIALSIESLSSKSLNEYREKIKEAIDSLQSQLEAIDLAIHPIKKREEEWMNDIAETLKSMAKINKITPPLSSRVQQ